MRRAAAVGQVLPWYWCVWGMLQRAVLAGVLFGVAAPGLLAWMPVWVYVKRRERLLMSRGPRWNDSVAETKMMLCGLVWLRPRPASLHIHARKHATQTRNTHTHTHGRTHTHKRARAQIHTRAPPSCARCGAGRLGRAHIEGEHRLV